MNGMWYEFKDKKSSVVEIYDFVILSNVDDLFYNIVRF